MIENKSGHTDFELEQYVHEVYHEVNAMAYSDDDGAAKEDKFTEYIMELLAEAGETEGIRLCPFMKENKNGNLELKINGYAIEDGFESVDLFITHYVDTNELYKLLTPDFNGLIKWSSNFLNAALKGHLGDIEPSTEAFGLASEIKKHRDDFIRVNIFLISNGNIPFETPKITIKSFEELHINLHIWDLERLHRLSQSKYNREPIELDFQNVFNFPIPFLEMPVSNEFYECFLCIVPGELLSVLYRNYGTRLLESNVRAFLQQKNKYNKGIRKTINDEPYMFLPYNNGIAATADKVFKKEIDGKNVITGVRDFQIVNGGQTTASLYHTQKKDKADLSQVFVQMKLTIIKDEEKNEHVVPNIAKFANSQSPVSDLDLSSNNPLYIRFEELSRTTYAIDPEDTNKQSVWFFERVKGQYREAYSKEPTKSKQNAFKLKYPSSQKLIKADIAKLTNIYQRYPWFVSRGPSKNYPKFMDVAKDIFKKQKPTKVHWEDIVANAILFKATDKLFGRKNHDPLGDTNVKSYTVVYTLSLLHELTNGKIDFQSIWQKQNIDEDLQNELKKGLIDVYKFLTTLDNVALVSEAAKSEKTWKLLLDKKENPFDMDVIKKYCISEATYKKRYEGKEDDVEETMKYNNLQRITDLGIRFWDGLNLYMLRTDILSATQQNGASSIRGKLKRSGNFTAHDITKGVEVLDVLVKSKVNFDEITKLSKLAEKYTVDPSVLYNRFNKLEKSDWDQVLQLGEQTGTLSFNDTSVVKTVIQKLKRKENIDLRRLQIVEKAVNKLKKFGVKF